MLIICITSKITYFVNSKKLFLKNPFKRIKYWNKLQIKGYLYLFLQKVLVMYITK